MSAFEADAVWKHLCAIPLWVIRWVMNRSALFGNWSLH